MLEYKRVLFKHRLVKFKMNSGFPVNSVLLQRAAIAMEQEGRLGDFIEAGLQCMWEDDQKMDDKEVFVSALTEKGFDGATLLERTQNHEVKQKLFVNTDAAVERGVFGAPTFFVGDEMFFGKETVGLVEEEIEKQSKS